MASLQTIIPVWIIFVLRNSRCRVDTAANGLMASSWPKWLRDIPFVLSRIFPRMVGARRIWLVSLACAFFLAMASALPLSPGKRRWRERCYFFSCRAIGMAGIVGWIWWRVLFLVFSRLRLVYWIIWFNSVVLKFFFLFFFVGACDVQASMGLLAVGIPLSAFGLCLCGIHV